MSNFVNNISIRNFKSIRSCDIKDCSRINLFIGRPNVGKSNILEALGLFSIPYLRESASKKLSNLIQVENEPEPGYTKLAASYDYYMAFGHSIKSIRFISTKAALTKLH